MKKEEISMSKKSVLGTVFTIMGLMVVGAVVMLTILV